MQHVTISPDAYLYNSSGVYSWSPSRVKDAWAKSYRALAKAVSSKRYEKVVVLGGLPGAGKSTWLVAMTTQHRVDTTSVIFFDATFTNAWGRAKLIEHVRSRSKAIPIDMVFLVTPPALCIQRNAARHPSRRVPDETLRRMAASLQHDGLPSEAEGFSAVVVLSHGAAPPAKGDGKDVCPKASASDSVLAHAAAATPNDHEVGNTRILAA